MSGVCLKPTACDAKTPGKHCKRCLLTARNKTPEMREVSRATAIKHDKIRKAIAVSSTSEVRSRAAQSRLDNAGFWCPEQYRHANNTLRSQKVPLEERKQMIAQMIKDDANKPKVLSILTLNMEQSHERMKRGKKEFGGREGLGF